MRRWRPEVLRTRQLQLVLRTVCTATWVGPRARRTSSGRLLDDPLVVDRETEYPPQQSGVINQSICFFFTVPTTTVTLTVTSCARGDTICPRPSPPPWAPKCHAHRRADATYQFFPMPNTFPRWPLQPPYALRPRWVKQPGDLDLWPINLESGVRITCGVGYLYANFGLPRPLYSRLRPDVRDRQTDRQTDRQKVVRRQTKASRNAPPVRGGGIIIRLL